MPRVIRILFLAVISSAALCAGPAPKTKAHLLLSHSAAKPGEKITAALRMVSEPGWHTYWRNPGDAGIATSIEWTLPPGVTAGEIQWPVPEKMFITKLYAYVYEKEILLPIVLNIAPDAKPGNFSLQGAVSWLECSDTTCVPQDGKVSAMLTIGPESKLSSDSPLIEKWKALIPAECPDLAADSKWDGPANGKKRNLLIEWKPRGTVSKPDFFPFESESYAVLAPSEIVQADSQKIRLRKTVELLAGTTWPSRIGGLAIDQSGVEQPSACVVQLSPDQGGAAVATTAEPAPGAPIELPGASAAPASLLGILGLAFLGGIILNVMPCVLPVIALKILGFVNQSREAPGRVRRLGLLYMAGVLASFLILAGIILIVRRAAGDVNWGIQMQNPYFVVGMTALVTLVALNLWGVFEVTLPGAALGGASQLASREGSAGAFYNGVLATLLATPCTAPALGIAVGSVLTRPAHIVILTFLTIGFGLALPYVLLSWNPRWLKLLPKPGAWMEKFKMAMGFPMAATAVWLLSFGSKHFSSSGTLWLGLFLVMLALAAWIYGEFVQRGSRNRGFAMALVVLVLAAGYYYPLERKLHWRNLEAAESGSGDIPVEAGGIRWQRWSTEAVANARTAGHPVLVEFTADWCLLCQVNKETSIEIDSVRAKLKEINAVALLGDFTRRDKLIGQEINRFKRAGVPLVLVYPADPKASPYVLPEALTPGIVLNALDLAAKASGKPGGNQVSSAF